MMQEDEELWDNRELGATEEHAKRASPELEQQINDSLDLQTVSVDFPAWAVHKLDDEAKRIGGTRQALIRQIVIGFIDNREKFEFEKRKFDATQKEQEKPQQPQQEKQAS